MRNLSENENKGGDVFREWLSDRLRYFILLFALLIAIAAIVTISGLMKNRTDYMNRNAENPGSGSSSAVAESESEEEIVILSSEAHESAKAGQEENDESAVTDAAPAVKETEAKVTEAAETAAETEEKVTEAAEIAAETEEKVTEAAETAAETEEKVTEAAETAAETEEKVTEAAETAAETEAKETEAKETQAPSTEKEVTKTPETEEAVLAAAEESDKEEEPSAEEAEVTKDASKEDEEASTEKASVSKDRKGGLLTTSSTERSVQTSSGSSSRPQTAATLAGVGAEQESETESSVKTGSVTVTDSSRTTVSTGSASRTPVLVSGGSSTSKNRASVTNIDTGTTIGTYRRIADTGNTNVVVTPQTDAAQDTNQSGGLIEAGSTTYQDTSMDGTQQEIVIAAPEAPAAPEPEYRTVVSACNIRSYPDYGDNVIGSLGGGETVLFYGLEGGWDKIEYNGIVGYIGPKFLQ